MSSEVFSQEDIEFLQREENTPEENLDLICRRLFEDSPEKIPYYRGDSMPENYTEWLSLSLEDFCARMEQWTRESRITQWDELSEDQKEDFKTNFVHVLRQGMQQRGEQG